MTGLEVSPIAFGTWQLGGEWGSSTRRGDRGDPPGPRARGQPLRYRPGLRLRRLGALLGRALRDELDNRRDEVVIATKGGLRMTDDGLVRDSSPAWLRGGVEDSLSALGVDHVDIYQVHWPDPNVPFAETAAALQELVDEGKIRHVGVSNFDSGPDGRVRRTRPVETLQPPYDLFRRDDRGGDASLRPEHDIGVLVYGPLAHGLLTGALDENTNFASDDGEAEPRFKGETFVATWRPSGDSSARLR